MNRPLSVLIVDDNLDCADSLALLVKLWGHVPFVAYSGAEALKLAHVQQFDMAVLDLRMPRMSGPELARRLRGDLGLHNLLLIAVTGEEPSQPLLAESGFAHHLVKPNHVEVLERLLVSTPVV
jgi:CheY-like chemotaxis protein